MNTLDNDTIIQYYISKNNKWEFLIENIDQFEENLFNYLTYLNIKEINKLIQFVIKEIHIENQFKAFIDIFCDLFSLNINMNDKDYYEILLLLYYEIFDKNKSELFYIFIKNTINYKFLKNNKILYEFLKKSLQDLWKEGDNYDFLFFQNTLYRNYKWLSQQDYNSQLIKYFNWEKDIKKLLYKWNWEFLE